MAPLKQLPRDSEGRVPTLSLDAMAAEIGGTQQRIDKLEAAFETFASSMTSKLDRVFNELTRQQAQPRYEPGKLLGLVTQCAVLIGMAVTAVGFVINAYLSADIARQDERTKFTQWRVERLEKGMPK